MTKEGLQWKGGPEIYKGWAIGPGEEVMIRNVEKKMTKDLEFDKPEFLGQLPSLLSMTIGMHYLNY